MNRQRRLLLFFLCSFPFLYPSLGFSKSYNYNLNGDIKCISHPNGKEMQIEYDAVDRVSRIAYSSGKEVVYKYDLNDNRIQMTDWRGTTAYVYDRLNRLTEVHYPGTDPLLYEYDVSNHITHIKYPSGEEIFYHYNAEGRLKTVLTQEGATTFFYDNPSHTLSKIILPIGITTEYKYDLSKRVTDVIHTNSPGNLLLSYHYKYDAHDNCVWMEEKSGKKSKKIEYTYDKLHRLTQVNYSDGTFEKYTYDGFGNRITKETQQGIEPYVYDSHNCLRKKGQTEFFYDETGNLRQKKNGDQLVEYSYDENDLLIAVKSPYHLVLFEYDGDGKRISKTVDGIKTYYINDAVFPISQVLIETDEKKQIQASYTYAERRLSCASWIGQSRFYLYDHPARNVAAVVGEHDRAFKCYSYDGFGALRCCSEGMPNPFQYAGEEWDEETGLIYLRNRYYDPELGRFITPDHRRGNLLKPQSWNPYVYVLNNPINLVDPLGLDALKAVAYPPGTMTQEGKSCVGHVFIILTRTSGEEISMGKYPTLNPFKNKISPRDRIYPGSVAYSWEITSEVGDAIAKNFGKDGFYLLAKNNCADAVLKVIREYVDPDFGGTKLLGVNNPTSFMEVLSEKNAKPCNYLKQLNQIKANIWENYEQDALAPSSYGMQHFWRHFLGVGDRGGVALNKTADLMVDLADILGATFDEQSGQLILVGKRNYVLPAFNSDDFAVAVRSIYGLGFNRPQDPGVSMEPYPEVRPKEMRVRYDGETMNTEFGRIMFEADRLLKNLSLGEDNLTHKKVKVYVKGYKHLPKRYKKMHHPPKNDTYTRLWFVPEEIRVVQSEDSSTMQFEQVKMKVLAEAHRHQKRGTNSAAEAFAAHFTNYYDEYAHQFPILKELNRLGQITGVVKWLKDNQVLLDLSFFRRYQPKYVPTPLTTGLTVVSYGRHGCIAGGIIYRLDGNNFFQKNGEGIEKMKEWALQSRPRDTEFAWDFNENGASYLAVAQTLCRTPKTGNVKKNFIDMSFPVEGEHPLALVHTYNSFEDQAFGFGMGWTIAPARLRFPEEKRMLHNSEGQSFLGYPSILVTDEGMERLYKAAGIDVNGLIVYWTGEGFCVLKEDRERGFVLFKRNKGRLLFDQEGRLQRMVDKEGIYVDYLYEESNLVSIAHQSGKKIQLKYVQGRICQAEGDGGKRIAYSYDDRVQLRSAADESGLVSTFFYDGENRLTEIKNSHGKTVFSARYDLYGRAERLEEGSASFRQQFSLKEKSSQITDSQQVTVTKLFDESFRLKTIEDSLDRKVEISYRVDSFVPKTIKDPLGYVTAYNHSANGNLESIERPDGSKKEFWYDTRGLLVMAKDGNGVFTANAYDDKGRIISRALAYSVQFDEAGGIHYVYNKDDLTIYEYEGTTSRLHAVTHPGGKREIRTYHENGQLASVLFGNGYCLTCDYDEWDRLKKLSDGSGLYVQYEYGQDAIRSVTTPASQMMYEKEGNTLIASDGNGECTSFVYDDWNRLDRIVDAEGGITLYKYDESARLKEIFFPNGSKLEFDHDRLHQPIEEQWI